MIDYNELAQEIRGMKPRTRLYNVLKAELKALGHWRDKPRGAGFKKGADPRRVVLKPTAEPKVGADAVAAARLLRLRRKKMDLPE